MLNFNISLTQEWLGLLGLHRKLQAFRAEMRNAPFTKGIHEL